MHLVPNGGSLFIDRYVHSDKTTGWRVPPHQVLNQFRKIDRPNFRNSRLMIMFPANAFIHRIIQPHAQLNLTNFVITISKRLHSYILFVNKAINIKIKINCIVVPFLLYRVIPMNNFSFILSDEFHKTIHRIYLRCNLFRDDDWKSLFNERFTNRVLSM